MVLIVFSEPNSFLLVGRRWALSRRCYLHVISCCHRFGALRERDNPQQRERARWTNDRSGARNTIYFYRFRQTMALLI